MNADLDRSSGWIKFSVRCDFDNTDGVSELLERFGACAVTIDGIDIKRSVRQATVTGLFGAGDFPDGRMRGAVQELLGKDSADEATAEHLLDRDWVRESQSTFEPITISDRVRIVAPWHDLTDAEPPHVVINPGLAFGTGHHPTTRLCLESLACQSLAGLTVIDIGCGSGILAAAALVMGARFAWGLDVDAEAIAQSVANIELNGLQKRFKALSADHPDVPRLTGDIVVANLYSELLVDMSDKLPSMVASGGRIALSGILDHQAQAVAEAYGETFELTNSSLQGWTLLVGEKRVAT